MLNRIVIVIETKHYQSKKIRRYLKDIINNLKKSDAWKIQFTLAINFLSSKDTDEERSIDSNNDNSTIKMKLIDKVKHID